MDAANDNQFQKPSIQVYITHMLPPLLFNKIDIFSVCENQKRSLETAASAYPEPAPTATDDQIVAELIEQFCVEVPVLHEDKMSVSESEIDIDVSRDPYRMFIDRPSAFYIKGTEITVHIPFTGEAELFGVQPRTYTLSPPRGIVSQGELLLRFQYPNDKPPPDLRGALDDEVRQIKMNLDTLRASSEQLRWELRAVATAAWQQRKLQFSSRSQVLAGLGLPRRGEMTVAGGTSISGGPVLTRTKSNSRPSAEAAKRPAKQAADRWQIFISHASEDKTDIAKPLADALIAAGYSVWYDDYTLSVGDSLRQKIDDGLRKSDFGIVILSKAFFEKHWPQQELNGLASREANGKKVILPVWHNISRDEITAASPILADRLGVPTTLGIEFVVGKLVKAMQ